MTKFATYQRPRTGKADGPIGPAGKAPRWGQPNPGPFAPIRKGDGKPGNTPALPDLDTLLKATGPGSDKR